MARAKYDDAQRRQPPPGFRDSRPPQPGSEQPDDSPVTRRAAPPVEVSVPEYAPPSRPVREQAPQAPVMADYNLDLGAFQSPHGPGAKPSRDVLPPPQSPAEEAYKPFSRMTAEERIRAFRRLNDTNYNSGTLSRF